MAGNVSEWVMDVYRPVIERTTTADHRSFSGNVFQTDSLDADGAMDLLRIKTVLVSFVWCCESREDNTYRRRYKKADNINCLDGDIESQAGY